MELFLLFSMIVSLSVRLRLQLWRYQVPGRLQILHGKSKFIRKKLEERAVKGTDRIGSAPVIDMEAMRAEGKKKSFG